ncbi:hypothetical protein OAF98_05525 [Planctomicrobium sp.]|nr:hypothetical protein [Planctomicrobium sp.]MDB4743927.1 hypothetical protein [Planctomicrobium sp.]
MLKKSLKFTLFTSLCCLQFLLSSEIQAAEPIRIATFDVDASTPVGSPLAYDPSVGVQTPLSCRGIVFLSEQKPIVLCAVDWLGIASGGQTVFKEALAAAAQTDTTRVVVHTLHQHDAPRCDFTAFDLLSAEGAENIGFDERHARSVVNDAANAITKAIPKATPVTHIGRGEGTVEKVASNRKILGEDGKVKYTRFTATRDPKIRAFPAGTIDPMLKSVSFWNEDKPVAVLTYYATHPQSYYRTGLANPDFPGLARNSRQAELGVPHIHFNGAGGNIGAGKWNDGSKENRQVLADRVADGMKKAWEATKKTPMTCDDIRWKSTDVLLPVADHLDEELLVKTYKNKEAAAADRWFAAKNLTWLRRCQMEDPIQISCLKLGDIEILHLPGELFVEYQLSAQKMAPDRFVPMAAYGDYAPGYIGTRIAYSQGGYEPSARASRVSPEVEELLLNSMQHLLNE